MASHEIHPPIPEAGLADGWLKARLAEAEALLRLATWAHDEACWHETGGRIECVEECYVALSRAFLESTHD